MFKKIKTKTKFILTIYNNTFKNYKKKCKCLKTVLNWKAKKLYMKIYLS